MSKMTWVDEVLLNASKTVESSPSPKPRPEVRSSASLLGAQPGGPMNAPPSALAEPRRYKYGNEPRQAVGDRVRVPAAGWVWLAEVTAVDVDEYVVRIIKQLFELKPRRLR